MNCSNKKKEDYLIIPPVVGINNFNQSGEIQFVSSSTNDYLYLPDSFLRCEFEIEDNANNKLKKDADITLENNWFPKLFNDIILRVGNVEVDNLYYPGECDSILKLVQKNRNYENNGWIPDRGDGKIVEEVDKSAGANYTKAEIDKLVDRLNELDTINTG